MNIHETQKENIAGLYHRVASTYGQVGPNFFSYAGQHLVERIGMTEGTQVLDVAAGRGANLFPAAEVVGPQGRVIGIDLAEGMVQETTAEIFAKLAQEAQSDGIHETLRIQYILADKGTMH